MSKKSSESNKPSERRLAENEVVFRQLNEQVQKGIEETNQLAVEANQPEYIITYGFDDPPLHFYCECSDENCTKRILINLQEYNEIHKNRNHFTVFPGHEVLRIERLVREEPDFNVVEKIIEPPKSVGELQPTDVDNS